MKQESGISYFPLNCSFDDNVELMIAEFGLKGLGILIRLYQKIYSNGYYVDWNTDVALLFARNNGLGCDFVSEVLQCCLRREIFNNEMYHKFNILTSKGIQERYFEVVKRRKEIKIKNEYLLISVPSKSSNVYKSEENVCKSEENVYISEQSKGKESKVKESRVKESREKKHAPTLEEVKKFVSDEKLIIKADKFFNYYQVKHWAGIEDWKALARYWNAGDKGDTKETSFDTTIFSEWANNFK